MATVTASITWANHEVRLRAYLGIVAPTDEDTLKGELLAATRTADRFMNNPFVDDDLVDVTIPDDVVLGVDVWIKTIREVAGTLAPTAGVTSVKVGDNSVGYAGSKVTKISPSQAAMDAARPFWQFYRKKIWG